MATISILIVSYNTRDVLADCLRSVFASQLADTTVQVILVDNNSSDGSADMVAAAFPQVTLIRNTENAGFGKANNQAYEKSTGEYILLLNPDTIVPPTAIAELLRFCQLHQPIGAAAPQLRNKDGSMQPSCYRLPTISGAFAEFFLQKPGTYLKYAPPKTGPTKVAAAVGACLMLPRTTIQQIGMLFDERFYFYYEDIDLCRRLAAHQFPIYYVPSITVTHLHGESAKQRGSWAYEQNQRSAKIYFGTVRYAIITAILKYGQKWQKLRGMIHRVESV